MSVVERVEREIAHSLLWNEETGTEHGASVPLSDLRALLALVKAVQAFEDYGDAVNESDADPEDPDILSKLTELSDNIRTALAAVTRGEG
jgi:hypothetical protein